MTTFLILLSFLALISPFFVLADVSLQWPLDTQLPPVARVKQPYDWTFSDQTFVSDSNSSMRYTAYNLPSWLIFDPTQRTFTGTPGLGDVGYSEISVTARDSSSSSETSKVSLCVSKSPPPVLNRPIEKQFLATNPSLSSVYLLSLNSALATSNPALRVPPKWSFSVGFEYDTFVLQGHKTNVRYEVRMSDGGPLPDWMQFNPRVVTLDGVTPRGDNISLPLVVPLQLHASDEEGYSASTQSFDLVVAQHELSIAMDSLPTLNVTISTQFRNSLASPDDFKGVMVDGRSIELSQFGRVDIDTSSCSGVSYNAASRNLTGITSTRCSLPVTVATTFNQSLRTVLPINVVPSYFTVPELPPYILKDDGQIDFDLKPFVSSIPDDAILTAYAILSAADKRIPMGVINSRLSGQIPTEGCSSQHIIVSLTAYSRFTHSTSHANLPIVCPHPDLAKKPSIHHPSGLSAAAHAKLVLALAITLSVIGGVCVLGGCLAACRHVMRVEDTAVVGEAGQLAWTEHDRKWYGEKYSDETKGGDLEGGDHSQLNTRNPFDDPAHILPTTAGPIYRHMGLGLQRMSERSQSNPMDSPGVMSKREFFARIRQTIRKVSDKYATGRRTPSGSRLGIGRPIVTSPFSNNHAVLPALPGNTSGNVENPFGDNGLPSNPGSTFLADSPSTSTDDRSIPRRRADFAPPRTPPKVLIEGRQESLTRQPSAASTSSLRSAPTHPGDVGRLVTDSKGLTPSVRSEQSASGVSHDSSLVAEFPQVPLNVVSTAAKPRLVPFTSATRVPIPKVSGPPTVSGSQESQRNQGFDPSKRIASQVATIWKAGSSTSMGLVDGVDNNKTITDDLSVGLHYVETLGAVSDTRTTRGQGETTSRLPQPSSSASNSVQVRIGERFKFSMPIPATFLPSLRSGDLEAKLVSGGPLPRFLHVDLNVKKNGGSVELYGSPLTRDVGEVEVGVYTTNTGVCVAHTTLDVVNRKS